MSATAARPVIYICSEDTDDFCRWVSGGWYSDLVRRKYKRQAQAIFDRAKECIEAAKDIPDAVRLLEEAGFEVRRGELW